MHGAYARIQLLVPTKTTTAREHHKINTPTHLSLLHPSRMRINRKHITVLVHRTRESRRSQLDQLLQYLIRLLIGLDLVT